MRWCTWCMCSNIICWRNLYYYRAPAAIIRCSVHAFRYIDAGGWRWCDAKEYILCSVCGVNKRTDESAAAAAEQCRRRWHWTLSRIYTINLDAEFARVGNSRLISRSTGWLYYVGLALFFEMLRCVYTCLWLPMIFLNELYQCVVHLADSRRTWFIIALVAILVVCGILFLTVCGVVRCLRTTPRASTALALPIPLLTEDQTPLNAEPDQPVPVSHMFVVLNFKYLF